MKLNYLPFQFGLDFSAHSIYTLTVENPMLLSKMISSLQEQIQGLEGDFVLADADLELKFSKIADLIVNPFSLDINEKRVLTKLYKEIEERTKEELYQKLSELNGEMLRFIEKMVQLVPYGLDYLLEVGVTDFLKLYHVKIVQNGTLLIDSILSYIKSLHQLAGVELFIFVHLKQFLEVGDIEALYKEAEYENVKILILEGNESETIFGEEHWIIDKDLCMIKE